MGRLRELLELLGMSQKEFAESIGITGNAITEIFKGRSKGLSEQTLRTMNEVHGININWYLTGVGSIYNKEPSRDKKSGSYLLQAMLIINVLNRKKSYDAFFNFLNEHAIEKPLFLLHTATHVVAILASPYSADIVSREISEKKMTEMNDCLIIFEIDDICQVTKQSESKFFRLTLALSRLNGIRQGSERTARDD